MLSESFKNRLSILAGVNVELRENIVLNKNSNINIKLVEINYNNTWLKAIEIGYGQAHFFKTSYILIDDSIIYDFQDISNSKEYSDVVREIQPEQLLK